MDFDIEPMGLAVVTGATSGIGLELARELGARRFDLLLVAEDPGIEFVARTLRGDSEADAIQVDLATAEGVEDVYAAVVERGEQVEVLVLSAGAPQGGSFLCTPLEAELDAIKLGCLAMVHLAKRLLPAMVNAGSGHVIIAPSPAAEGDDPLEPVCDAARTFQYSFARALAKELELTGVTVSLLVPGGLDPVDVARKTVDDMLIERIDFIPGWKFRMPVAAAPGSATPLV